MAAVLIHEPSTTVTDVDGTVYRAQIFGEEQPDGHWTAWIEFVPTVDAATRRGHRRRTGQETTQPDLAGLEYWATGLEPIYLDGALTRALARSA
ncbi:MAG TPA: hypothetical protein VFJ96_01975 [Gemmatimonadaceae bacterium]|nr:hypothetical protein [Gemmatimonadaceae bacterium]